ncbi:uncharacterized protein LOC128954271 [Oppia nitens]|uniref:uncharacterized protein LOC128954271 n=1 Tax=Oppia nitens TaxID=1686743 RepID=UPI0023D9BE60|nr:uncharacterized protein LOC128954271 [Oppia nitens]
MDVKFNTNRHQSDIRYTTSFRVKKWALFTFCAISIIAAVIMAGVTSLLVNAYYENNDAFNRLSQEDRATVKTFTISIIYVALALAILFDLLGLMGAYKEHFCMTTTYAVLMTLGSLGSIDQAVRNPYYSFNTVINFVVAVLAIAFAYDLYRRRQNLFSGPVVIQTSGGAPVSYVLPTPTGGANVTVATAAEQPVQTEKDGKQYDAVPQDDMAEPIDTKVVPSEV